MTRETADQLRRQFPGEQIGKLPRGNIVLDYVGHADTTSRLLEVDPEWNWEPLSYAPDGMPLFDLADNGRPVGLWIKLTVCGVTRLGYGSVPANQNDAVKVLIGDALRNAAMRFGVALDLWAKGDRADPTAENPSGSAGHAVRAKASRAKQPQKPVPFQHSDGNPAGAQELAELAREAKSVDELRAVWKSAGAAGALPREISADGAKMTLQEYLYARNDQLTQPKSAPSRGGAVAAEGDPGSGGNS